MKIKDISKNYGVDEMEFERFCNQEKTIEVKGAFSSSIADNDVERAVNLYKQAKAEKADADKAKADAAAEKQRFLASMLITSGFNFDGYTIKKYSGYISGDDATTIPRTGLTKWLHYVDESKNSQNLTEALVKIRRKAIQELKEAAYDLGCNAVIGVDFDYITLDPQTANSTGGTTYEDYVICVTANGNAVVIEKNT